MSLSLSLSLSLVYVYELDETAIQGSPERTGGRGAGRTAGPFLFLMVRIPERKRDTMTSYDMWGRRSSLFSLYRIGRGQTEIIAMGAPQVIETHWIAGEGQRRCQLRDCHLCMNREIPRSRAQIFAAVRNQAGQRKLLAMSARPFAELADSPDDLTGQLIEITRSARSNLVNARLVGPIAAAPNGQQTLRILEVEIEPWIGTFLGEGGQ